jgi:hypothetical protein
MKEPRPGGDGATFTKPKFCSIGEESITGFEVSDEDGIRVGGRTLANNDMVAHLTERRMESLQ